MSTVHKESGRASFRGNERGLGGVRVTLMDPRGLFFCRQLELRRVAPATNIPLHLKEQRRARHRQLIVRRCAPARHTTGGTYHEQLHSSPLHTSSLLAPFYSVGWRGSLKALLLYPLAHLLIANRESLPMLGDLPEIVIPCSSMITSCHQLLGLPASC